MLKFKKENKYKAMKTEIDGIKFDSLAEASYYEILKHRQKMGVIEILELQPKVYLSKAKILFKPDFLISNYGVLEYHEVKGKKHPVYNLKKRLFKFYGKHKLVEVSLKGRHFEITDEVICEKQA